MTENNKTNRPVWDIDESDPEKINDLIEGLAGITDPELGYSILELGLLRNVAIKSDQAKITMILTTPYCPYGPSMMEATRVKAERILEMPTSIEYGSETWDPKMMEVGLMDEEWGLY